MTDFNQCLKAKGVRFDECRKRKLAIKTLLKSVVSVTDFIFSVRILVVAMRSEIGYQVTHRVHRMAEYCEQYRKA